MDFTKLEVNDTTIVHIEGPDGNALFEQTSQGEEAVTITIYGPGTKQYLRAQQEVNNKFMTRLQAKGSKAKETADEKLQRDAEFLSACYAGSAYVSIGAEAVSSKEQAKALFLNPKLGFIVAQLNAKMGDWANFTKDSATS